MSVIILSNGSKWAGQEPDTIEDLLDVLATSPLDRRFENYGNFYTPMGECKFCDDRGVHNHSTEMEGMAHFGGNFFELSHVFSIYTDEQGVIDKLLAAVQGNQKRDDYLEQKDPEKVEYRHERGEYCRCAYCLYDAHKKDCPVCSGKVEGD